MGGNAPSSVRQVKMTEAVNTIELRKENSSKLLVHVHSQSIRLIESEEGHSLSFTFDCIETCYITIYYFGAEVVDSEMRLEYFTTYKPHHHPQSYKFSEGLNQAFPVNVSQFPLKKYSEKELRQGSEHRFPLIIVIKPESPEGLSEATFISFVRKVNLKVIKQKIYSQNEAWELSSIYTNKRQNENECVICMEKEATTTMMPCKHLCICADCEEQFKNTQHKKCPMCRSPVKKILKFN